MDDLRSLNQASEVQSSGGISQVPARFNFTRDVVEAFAADRLRPALTFVDSYGVIDRRSFANVASGANRWAALLRARGLVPGDRLLVLVGNSPAWPTILLGALKAGLVTVPCPVTMRAHELAIRGEHSDAQLVVTDAEGARELARISAPVEVVLVEEVSDELQRFSPVQPTHDTESDTIAFILYTSGTTSEPRGAVHTHAYTWANRLQAEHWLDARPGDLVWCTATPGWAKSIWSLLGPWSRGAEILIHEGALDLEQRFELIERLGVTVLCQTPDEYRMMANHPSMARLGLGRLRHAVSTGGPLDPAVSEAFSSASGLTVCEGYGQTESTVLVANAPVTQVRTGSMGRPTPGHTVAVIDSEGNEQPAGTEGEIALWGKPPSLFLEYWDAPDETSAVFRGPWYLTGDRAVRDEDGYLWFAGRTEDIIVSSANPINAFEIERALLEHPSISECAVVGKPNADVGELVKAFVVLAPGVESSDELVAELQDWVVAATTAYKSPREIAFVAELPRTANGKIHRAELRQVEHSIDDRADEEHHGRARPAAEALVQEKVEHDVEALPPEGRRDKRDEPRLDVEKGRGREEEKAAAEKARRDAAKARRAANIEAKAKADKAAADKARRDAAKARRAANIEAKAKADKAAADKARRDAAKARRAANIEAKAKADKAAADKARRDAAKARRAANIEAKAKADKAAADKARRDAAKARRAANIEAKAKAQTADQPQEGQREKKKPVRDAAAAQTSDTTAIPDSPDAALISRVRAYARRDDTADRPPRSEV